MDKIPKKKSKLLFAKTISLAKDDSASCDGAKGEDGKDLDAQMKGDADKVLRQRQEAESSKNRPRPIFIAVLLF
jgi:hypothetical protein